MRNRYFVAYDVSDPQRLMRMYKKMLGYGDRMQYSVFACNLNESELIMMRGELEGILNLKEDRVIIINTGSANVPSSRNVITMGTQIRPDVESTIVI